MSQVQNRCVAGREGRLGHNLSVAAAVVRPRVWFIIDPLTASSWSSPDAAGAGTERCIGPQQQQRRRGCVVHASCPKAPRLGGVTQAQHVCAMLRSEEPEVPGALWAPAVAARRRRRHLRRGGRQQQQAVPGMVWVRVGGKGC